jgi:hypothetical protein
MRHEKTPEKLEPTALHLRPHQSQEPTPQTPKGQTMPRPRCPHTAAYRPPTRSWGAIGGGVGAAGAGHGLADLLEAAGAATAFAAARCGPFNSE